MHQWTLYFRRGCRALRQHQPVHAIRWFKAALRITGADSTASARRREKARTFRLLGTSYWKAGMRNQALGSWVESHRLLKREPVRRRILRTTNPYGMARQETAALDDRHAFYGVQLARYLRSKKSRKLGTRAEVDMLVELLNEHWTQLCESEEIGSLSHDARLVRFRETMVFFPFLSVPEGAHREHVAVDFCRGTRVGPGDRCTCGSGLLFETCHGRIPGIDEVLTGGF